MFQQGVALIKMGPIKEKRLNNSAALKNLPLKDSDVNF